MHEDKQNQEKSATAAVDDERGHPTSRTQREVHERKQNQKNSATAVFDNERGHFLPAIVGNATRA